MALGLVLGLVLERGVMRLVYGRDEVVMVLVTYAAFLILEDVVILVWGPRSYATYQPLLAAGNIEIGELVLSNYDLGLIAIAAAARRAVLLGAEIHPLRTAADRRDLRSRNRGRLRHQCHAWSIP